MSLRSVLGLGSALEAAFPPPGATHVLYFAPPGCPDYAAWYLVSAADWCSGLMPRDWTFLGELRADCDLADQFCASFAAETLGFPVTLAEFAYSGASRWKTVPAYWLTPAGGGW
jgi:hypothetical protein